jgi:hypothetical protein
MSARIGAFYAETGSSFADLRDEFLAGRVNLIDQVFDRAVERGEADPAKLTPRVRSVTFDLFRHEVLMTHRPVPDDVIASIIESSPRPVIAARRRPVSLRFARRPVRRGAGTARLAHRRP